MPVGAASKPSFLAGARRAVAVVASRPLAWLGAHALTLFVGLAVFGLAYDGGAYSITSRSEIAVGAWWAAILLVGLSLWPLSRVPRAALASGGLIAGLAAFTALSMLWSDGAENAFLELNRVALYLGVFVIVVSASRRGSAARWSDGIALGITAVGLLSLTNRLFPHLIGHADISRYFPGDSRPAWPVNYWNGLAVLVGLSVPLLLRAGVSSRSALQRALALAPLPALAAVIYLTSSRSGSAAAILGLVLFVVLTDRRFRAALAAAIGIAGSAAAILVLQTRDQLVNGPFNVEPALSQGRSAAILLGAICVATGAAYAIASRIELRTPPLGARLKRGLAIAAIALAAGGVIAAHPGKRLDDFKQPPSAPSGSYTASHLVSGGGSGRWQFWQAAVKEFESKPLTGRGAGSYPAWWAQHGSISYFTRNAHSLYLETLAELGVIGLVLLLGFLGWGLASLAGRVRSPRGAERATVAAIGAAFIGFLLSSALDWMWQLTVVGALGVALLALLTGPATLAVDAGDDRASRSLDEGASRSRRRYFALTAGFVLVGMVLILAQGSTLFSQVKIRDSQLAAARNDTGRALSDAKAADDLEPWAASPALQVALVQEQRANFPAAQTWARRAVDRDPSNWAAWLVAARIESEAGSPDQARKSLARAKALNPRSPLFD